MLHWLETAKACDYIKADESAKLEELAETAGKQLGSTINQHEPFCF